MVKAPRRWLETHGPIAITLAVLGVVTTLPVILGVCGYSLVSR